MSPFTGSTPRTSTWQHLRLDLAPTGVATVTLARPEKLNALTFGAYADLRDLLAELSRERSVRALVLAGEGRGFCSGGDVDEIIGATLSMDTAQLLDFNRMTGQVVRAVRECPFPVIAAVHGVAAGAGAVLALAADFRVADPSARFAFLFTRVGLSGGDMGAAYLLPRVVGLGHATRLLMLGEPVRAPEAERIGLISELTDEGQRRRGRPDAGPSSRRRARHSRYAQTKALLTAELDMPLAAAVETGRRHPGPPDERRGLRGVPRRVHREAPPEVAGPMSDRCRPRSPRARLRDQPRGRRASRRRSAADPAGSTPPPCSSASTPTARSPSGNATPPTTPSASASSSPTRPSAASSTPTPSSTRALQRGVRPLGRHRHRPPRHHASPPAATASPHWAAAGCWQILHERCRSLGVELRFRTEAPPAAELAADARPGHRRRRRAQRHPRGLRRRVPARG